MIENSIVYKNLKKNNFFRLSKAAGSLLWDHRGKKYIDFTSGWNVTNLGWNHPEVNDAIAAQLKKNTQGLLWGSDPIQEEYAAALTAALPRELNACAKATGGTEAIEESIKIARAATGRKKIIGFKNSYHGQSFAALALGYSPEMVKKIAPLVPEFLQLEFPTQTADKKNFQNFLTTLNDALANHDIAAVITEPGIITGWGSTFVAYPGFLKAVRELTKKYNTLLIVDEVGTGFSRTGKLFAIEHENVVPDMIVLAKGISNGAAAIGTVVGSSHLFQATFPHVSLVSTFGWTPLACAAALQTIKIHQREKIWEQAERKGNLIRQKLRKLVGQSIVELRGKGMEIGVELKNAATARKVIDTTFKRGLHLVVGCENNIQIMPPLTIPQELLEEGLEIFISTLLNL